MNRLPRSYRALLGAALAVTALDAAPVYAPPAPTVTRDPGPLPLSARDIEKKQAAEAKRARRAAKRRSHTPR